ncbi:MAG: methyltransferase domain-containing protein [Proteobacteria bacterium]|nr:methyltransferase domain-containing protein [Pseudomonadota bacterium]
MPASTSENPTRSSLWASPLGERLVRQEAALLQPLLRRLHGDAVLWIGEQASMPQALGQCMVRHAVHAGRQITAAGSADLPRIRTSCSELPFATASLDGVVLHHSLEGSRDPRACIREVERVLKPGGRLIICAFNPFSLTGLRARFMRSRSNPLHGHRPLSPLRLLDWLALLNLCSDERPKFRSVSAPLFVPATQSLYRRMSASIPATLKRLVLPRYLLGQIFRFAVGLRRRVPLGGIVIVSAVKESEAGSLIGRGVMAPGPRAGKLVLAPSTRAQHKVCVKLNMAESGR